MVQILKYGFPFTPAFGVQMHYGAVILSLQMQGTEPKMWALSDLSCDIVIRKFEIYGTGQPIERKNDLLYISTFQDFTGFVWHVFERI